LLSLLLVELTDWLATAGTVETPSLSLYVAAVFDTLLVPAIEVVLLGMEPDLLLFAKDVEFPELPEVLEWTEKLDELLLSKLC
jgi:hypothetical protein